MQTAAASHERNTPVVRTTKRTEREWQHHAALLATNRETAAPTALLAMDQTRMATPMAPPATSRKKSKLPAKEHAHAAYAARAAWMERPASTPKGSYREESVFAKWRVLAETGPM